MVLTVKQERFCQEYLIDFNGTQAAIRAGYSAKTANEQAARLLTKGSIQNYIQSKQAEFAKKTEITREKVLAEYAKVAFHDIRELYDEDSRLKNIKDLTEETAAGLAGVEVDELLLEGMQIGVTKKVKRWDKIKALDGLSRVLGFNAPDKVAQTDTSGNDVKPPALTDSQFEKLIKSIKDKATVVG